MGPRWDAGEVIKLSCFLTPPFRMEILPSPQKKRSKRVLVSAVSAGWTADEILTEFAGRVEQLFDSSFRSFRLQVGLGLFG